MFKVSMYKVGSVMCLKAEVKVITDKRRYNTNGQVIMF